MNPSTPTRPRQAKPESGLSVTIIGSIAVIEIRSIEQQFLEYGSVMASIGAGAQIPENLLNWPSLSQFFRNSELLLTVCFFENPVSNWEEGQVILVTGSLNPWSISDRDDPDESPSTTMMWRTVLSARRESIQRLPAITQVDREVIQIDDIPCNFNGKICRIVESQELSLHTQMLQPLLDMGVFVELRFFLRRNNNNRRAGLKKGTYPFYVFLFIDDMARKRWPWVLSGGKLSLASGQGIYCSGTILGQLKEEFIERAGYEPGTPVAQSPVHLVVPTVELRLTDTAGPGPALNAEDVVSPSGQGYAAKLQRLRASRASASSGQGSNTPSAVQTSTESTAAAVTAIAAPGGPNEIVTSGGDSSITAMDDEDDIFGDIGSQLGVTKRKADSNDDGMISGILIKRRS
ncbi:hypothetical protein DL769_001925 [Monosporascus sp. CRB-8-3]|nr:hypothetical protein DL769_001925 [Monosporascus sp. CRB-8-3]